MTRRALAVATRQAFLMASSLLSTGRSAAAQSSLVQDCCRKCAPSRPARLSIKVFASACPLPVIPLASLCHAPWTSPWPTPSRHFASKASSHKGRKPRITPQAAATANFYAEQAISFSSLGLDEQVVAALERAGFKQPSRIQADCSEVLSSGSNTVIASETGSGKTLAYVAPIVSMLLRAKRRLENTERPWQYHALILCPNLALCQQVINVIQVLQDDKGQPLMTAAMVNSSTPPPFKNPDFILATPAGLMSFLSGAGMSYGLLWTPEGLQARVKHVVLDEADLLLTPAYSKMLNQVLQMLRSADRRRIEAKVFEELGIDDDVFERLPRQLQVAAWLGGTPGLLAAGYRARNPPAPDATLGPYWKRQYVFAAATMPAQTRDDVGSQIERFYPDAQWVASSALHTSKLAVTHTWTQVDDNTWQSSLIQAITEDPDHKAGKAKVLVFAKDTRSADQLSETLNELRIKHVVYHKNRSVEESRQALLTMQQEPSGVMVCTDAAARGIDIQDVTHVIQSDFAPNAIDFIHRIGRTGRAHRGGKVTSLYREENVPLVQVLQSYIEEGRPLEAAFSRARSFSKKLERRGMFIPRGMMASEYKKAQEQEDQEKQAKAESK